MKTKDILKTIVLKKDAFSWAPEAMKAFEHIKEEMCKALVLATPDFTKTFIVEYDSLGNGIGDFLTQEEKPIAFKSRPIKGKYLHKAIYEKEMLERLHSLKKWRPYIMRRSQFKQYCQNLMRKKKSYWNLEQSQKQQPDNYGIDQLQSILSSGRTYPLKTPHGRKRILYRRILNYSSIEENTF